MLPRELTLECGDLCRVDKDRKGVEAVAGGFDDAIARQRGIGRIDVAIGMARLQRIHDEDRVGNGLERMLAEEQGVIGAPQPATGEQQQGPEHDPAAGSEKPHRYRGPDRAVRRKRSDGKEQRCSDGCDDEPAWPPAHQLAHAAPRVSTVL